MQNVISLDGVTKGVLADQQGRESSDCSSGRCGTSPADGGGLPPHIREKIKGHPCYSEEAHHFAGKSPGADPVLDILR